MDTVTFVTAFFQVRKKENNPFWNDKENKHFIHTDVYLDKSKYLLETPIQLVIFTEPEFLPKIQARRPAHLPTKYIVYDFEDLPLWHLYEKMKENNKKNPISNLDPNKFTPLYHLLINHKTIWVQQAIQWNPFQSEYFGWIDFRAFGLSPIERTEFMGFKFHSHLVHQMQMAYTSLDEVKNKKEYYKCMRGKVSATFWVGHHMNLYRFCQLANQEFIKAVNEFEYSPTEEMVYGVVAAENPSLFHPYFGDYIDALSNFNAPIRNYYLAINYLNKSYKHGTHYLTHTVASALQKAYETHRINLNTDVLFQIWYKDYVALYWLNRMPEAKNRIQTLLAKCEGNDKLKLYVRHMKDFIIHNIQYLHDDSLTQLLKNI